MNVKKSNIPKEHPQILEQRVGVIIGSGVGGLLTMESQAQILSHKGPKRVSPFTVPMMIPNMATGLTTIQPTTGSDDLDEILKMIDAGEDHPVRRPVQARFQFPPQRKLPNPA